MNNAGNLFQSYRCLYCRTKTEKVQVQSNGCNNVEDGYWSEWGKEKKIWKYNSKVREFTTQDLLERFNLSKQCSSDRPALQRTLGCVYGHVVEWLLHRDGSLR